jgi:hypothetical protein
MDKIALKLQERLVQTCIDFINEYKDDEQVRQIERVEFSSDCLQESAKHGEWQSCTDSYCTLQGLMVMDDDINEWFNIDKSY